VKIGGAVGVLLLASICRAAAPEVGPTATVRTALGKASLIAAEGKTRDEQLEKLRVVARELVDTRSMGRRAIGGTFSTCTEAQQQEFLRLFDELFVRSYLQKLLLFRQPTFRFAREEKRGDAVIVSTEVLMGEDAYAVDYEMHQADDQWRAADVVVEGVSMTSNYSDQFTTLLRDRSFDELLDLMRRKLERFVGTDAG
jgi:phospholipid transport system substrate-binding protein